MTEKDNQPEPPENFEEGNKVTLPGSGMAIPTTESPRERPTSKREIMQRAGKIIVERTPVKDTYIEDIDD